MTTKGEGWLQSFNERSRQRIGLSETLFPEPLDKELSERCDSVLLDRLIKDLRQAIRGATARELSSNIGLESLMTLSMFLTLRGMRSGRFTEAYDVISRSVEEAPYFWKAQALRGQIGLLRGLKSSRWIPRAVDDLTLALVAAPQDATILYSRALCRLAPSLRDLDKAEKLRQAGQNKRALRLITKAEEMLCLAITDLEHILDSEPSCGNAHFHLGRCRSRLGQLEAAEAHLTEVIRRGKDAFIWSTDADALQKLVDSHLERAHLLCALERNLEAIEDLDRAFRMATKSQKTKIRQKRIKLGARARRFQTIVDDCTSLLEVVDDCEVKLERAKARLALGQIELARVDASGVLRRESCCVDALLLRARCSIEQSTWQSALADLDRCLALSPHRCDCLLLRAMVSIEIGDREVALNDLEGAKNLGATEEELSSLFEKLGEQERI